MDLKSLLEQEKVFVCKKVFVFKKPLYSRESPLTVKNSPDIGKVDWL